MKGKIVKASGRLYEYIFMNLGLDYLKIKNFFLSKHSIRREKGPAPEWEKILALCSWLYPE